MGIYLPNMEMPRKGEMLVIFPDGTSYVCFNGMRERLKHTTAFSVPPHGRLIAEADAIETTWMILRGLGYLKEENPQLEQTVREVFATAPAIEVEEHG